MHSPSTRTFGAFISQVGDDDVVSADHVLIASGGRPDDLGAPGSEYCINSDDFFALEEQPKTVAVIGAGYIAVELAGVFKILGSETHLYTRGETALRKFDDMVRTVLHHEMIKQGIEMHPSMLLDSVVLYSDYI